jgi:hypothetical protein
MRKKIKFEVEWDKKLNLNRNMSQKIKFEPEYETKN